MAEVSPDPSLLSRAKGCLLGQLAGDSLGSLVEFMDADSIRRRYPLGLRDLADGGTWNTIAGQPTDDSEMALLLARMLVDHGRYDPDAAFAAYRFWIDSRPFDCGRTIFRSLLGNLDPHSQANGALMRIAPLGIFGAHCPLDAVAQWARDDAALTHPHRVCQEANALFAMAIAHAIGEGTPAPALYANIIDWAADLEVDPSLRERIALAADAPPSDFLNQAGWVLIAFHNALHQLLHAPSPEQAITDTVMRGGDTDTNAAICGALLGAVHGREALPERWIHTILNCRPETGRPNVIHPRPECFWPVDALELADQLLTAGRQSSQ